MMVSNDTCTVVNNTKGKLPRLPFVLLDAKNAVLGKKYNLSVAIVTPKEIANLNKIYRNINKPTDILSFPLEKNEGEIYLCLSETKKMAKDFLRTYENFIAFLFIHGLCHLKGMDHGSTMEKEEIKFRKKFNI